MKNVYVCTSVVNQITQNCALLQNYATLKEIDILKNTNFLF